jgi:hypothetical protein
MRCGHDCGVWRDTTCRGAMLVGIQCVYDVCLGLFVLVSWVLNWRGYDDLLPATFLRALDEAILRA